MGSEPPRAVYDACVLYPFHLRNVLVQLAFDGLVMALWTERIHQEWIRNLVLTGKVSLERLIETRDILDAVLPEATIAGYEHRLVDLELPDMNDRHVLAAAIEGRASTIVTWNLRDFPREVTGRFNIEARDPDSFLIQIRDADRDRFDDSVERARANLRVTEPSMTEFLDTLERQGLIGLVRALR